MKEALLSRMINCTAATKFRNCRQKLTFADACEFWGIFEADTTVAVQERLNFLINILWDAEFETSFSVVVLDSGRQLNDEDIGHLSHLHDYLQARFSCHLSRRKPR